MRIGALLVLLLIVGAWKTADTPVLTGDVGLGDGFVITLVILKITWDAWRTVSRTDPGEMAER